MRSRENVCGVRLSPLGILQFLGDGIETVPAIVGPQTGIERECNAKGSVCCAYSREATVSQSSPVLYQRIRSASTACVLEKGQWTLSLRQA